jgi:hypothetical protein
MIDYILETIAMGMLYTVIVGGVLCMLLAWLIDEMEQLADLTLVEFIGLVVFCFAVGAIFA